jgi:hypothetical protein
LVAGAFTISQTKCQKGASGQKNITAVYQKFVDESLVPNRVERFFDIQKYHARRLRHPETPLRLYISYDPLKLVEGVVGHPESKLTFQNDPLENFAIYAQWTEEVIV